MRLWHEDLITRLPRQQLLGQHRECCALRGNGWGKKHATVDYVFKYSPYKLFQYHQLIMKEMIRRDFKPAISWKDPHYRGTNCPPYVFLDPEPLTTPIYAEHNSNYLEECLDNLKNKGITL
ncbi:TIGR02328 family protein [Enterococcus olivae]